MQSSLLDSVINNLVRCCVVHHDGDRQLGMPHLLEGSVEFLPFLYIGIKGTHFCFGSRCHNIADEFADIVDSALE
eukprot:13823325-Ditylum_brightwellii.AAC.1